MGQPKRDDVNDSMPIRPVDEALAEYFARTDQGEPIDREQFLAEHPEVAEELRDYFADSEALARRLARSKASGTPGEERLQATAALSEDLRSDPGVSDSSRSHGSESTVTHDGVSTPVRGGSAAQWIGDYQILGEIGSGGMGRVFKAWQRKLGRVVALKMILADRLATTESLQRFRVEAMAAAKLDHPGIVPIYEIGDAEGRHYYSMGLVEGRSLSQRLAEGPLVPRKAAAVIQKVAEAVHYAHCQGVIHRDLKPGNILLDKDEQPRVVDFGLAKQVESADSLTLTGQILGTPSYMAPEQASGSDVGVAADVYGLGAVLYALLVGRPPFAAAGVAETLRQVIETDPVAPRQCNPTIDADLDTICLKCLEKEPERRYADAAALAEDLRRLLANEAIAARPPNRIYRFGKFARRNRVLVGGVAATFLALVLGLVGTSIGLFRAVQAEEVASNETIRANEAAMKATLEADRARKAEASIKAEALQSYLRLAELAEQRGRLHEAIGCYDRALNEGHPSPAEVKIRRIEACMGVLDERRAREDIASLSNIPPQYAGKVLLLKGRLGMLENDRAAPYGYCRKAIEAGLSPADKAYANMVLAPTVPEAIQFAEESLSHRPFHYVAHCDLILLLIVAGRLDEAQRRIDSCRALFPEDTWLPVYRAFIGLLKGDFNKDELDRAIDRMEKAAPKDYKDYKEVLGGVRDLVGMFGDAEALWPSIANSDGDFVANARLLLMLPKLMNRISRMQQAPASGSAVFRGTTIRSLQEIMSLGLAAFLEWNTFRRDSAMEKLDRLLKVNPVCELHFFRAGEFLARGWQRKDDLAAAEQWVRRAWDMPMFLPRAAPFYRWGTTVLQVRLALLQAQSGAVDDQLRRRALENVRILYAMKKSGSLRPEVEKTIQYKSLAAYCRILRDHDLGRSIAVDWEAQSPKDPDAVYNRVYAEWNVGSFEHSLFAINRYEKLKPGQPDVARLRNSTVIKVRQLAETLSPPGIAQNENRREIAAAVWALRVGGRVQIVSGKQTGITRVTAVRQLPLAPYVVQSLDLKGCRNIQDRDLILLEGLTGLQRLDLSGTPITSASLSPLRAHRGLVWLDLSNTKVDDKGLQEVRGLSALRELNLRGTSVSNSPVEELRKTLPQCVIQR